MVFWVDFVVIDDDWDSFREIWIEKPSFSVIFYDIFGRKCQNLGGGAYLSFQRNAHLNFRDRIVGPQQLWAHTYCKVWAHTFKWWGQHSFCFYFQYDIILSNIYDRKTLYLLFKISFEFIFSYLKKIFEIKNVSPHAESVDPHLQDRQIEGKWHRIKQKLG